MKWFIAHKRAVQALCRRYSGISLGQPGSEQARIKLLEYETRAMQQREQEYLEILDGAADGSWIYDPPAGTVRYSERWGRFVGADSVPPEQRMAQWETMLHPEDRETVRQARRRAFMARKSKFELEYRLKTADGEYIWVMDRCKVIYDEAGSPAKVYGTSLDITPRKRTEEALRRSEALLRAIINGTRDPVFLKSRDGRILMANDATAVTLGLPLNGLPESGLPNENTAREWYGDMCEHDDWVMDNNDAVTVEEHVFSAGQERTFMTSKVPWHDEHGNVIGLIGIARDITERIRMERELRNTAQELAEKNALITDLFVNVSHEFRTPLAVMQMAVEILDEPFRRGDLNADRLRHSINIIDANTRRLTRLVGNMLDITRINAGAKQPSFAPVNIAALLRKLVELVKPYALQRGLEITLACRKTVRMLCTDAELVARIVVNLLSNAIKYTPRGGWVRVTCGGSSAGCRISVEDNGEGIPDDKQRLIFDHFHKANNTLVRSSEGCGIGLSLTKSLTELLGGSIGVKSKLGHGSAFFVDLPDRGETGAQQSTGLLSACLQDLVITELSDISF